MRRRILIAVAAAVATILPAGASADTPNGPLSSQTVFSGSPFKVWGLDSAVTWSRQDVAGESCCDSLLSLISDNTQPDSFAYPLTVTLNDTTSPAATMTSSQSTGVNVRAYSSSTGSPWLAGFHSEVWHGYSYPTLQTAPANGVTLAYNAEVHRSTPTGTVIGLELNGLGPLPGDDAINVGGQWKMGIELGQNDLHARDVLATDVKATGVTSTTISTGSLSTTSLSTTSLSADAISVGDTVQAKRFVLAPGVWIDYERGRIMLHRAGRIVARW